MIASAIAYILTALLVALGVGGFIVGTKAPTTKERGEGILVGLVLFCIAYGFAKLGGI